MAEITPRPASLSVSAVLAGKPGDYKYIQVSASSVRYYGMMIAKASFTFPLVRLDQQALLNGQLRFLEVPEVIIETHVSDDDLLKVFPFSNRSRQLSDLRLKISDKEIELRGNVKRGFLLIAFTIRGAPVLSGTKKIDFSCTRVHLNGVSLPRAAIRAMFSRVNPVFDATKTWLNLELSRISTENGLVHTWAKLRPAQIGECVPASSSGKLVESGTSPKLLAQPLPVAHRHLERNP